MCKTQLFKKEQLYTDQSTDEKELFSKKLEDKIYFSFISFFFSFNIKRMLTRITSQFCIRVAQP